jgi:DNA alkylation repair enzyme
MADKNLPDQDFSEAISLIISNFNKKLKSHLPQDHNQSELHTDSSIYYQKLNSTYLRSESRVLLKHTESWELRKVLKFFKYCMKEIPDRTFQMTVMFYMMYRYHEISADLGNLDVFQNWIVDGLFDRDSLTDFAEYCILPLVNYSMAWIMAILDWAKHPNVNVRRAAALGVRKCGVDRDKAHIVLEICRILLENCEETEIKCAIGQIMRQVGKKQKGILRVFLEESLMVLPRKSLVDGIVRLSKKEQIYYLAEHDRLRKKPGKHETLISLDSFEKSLEKKDA